MRSSYSNTIVSIVFLSLITLLIIGFSKMSAPLNVLNQDLKLDYSMLPEYALRTTMRLFLAILVSTIFGVLYALVCYKNKRIGNLLVPLLDVFQSVPVLGYISFTVTAFTSLFPTTTLGVELAVIFAIFTAQVWNMIFAVYQSFKTIPTELYEVGKIYRLNKWQVFWQIELPFALPGLIWNIVLSMATSWFFIVASEAISVGNQTYTLPGIGVYISIALKTANIHAVLHALLTILITIILINKLVLSPLSVWSLKFRYEFNTGKKASESWMFDFLQSSTVLNPFINALNIIVKAFLKLKLPNYIVKNLKPISLIAEVLWWCFVAYTLKYLIHTCHQLFQHHIDIEELKYVFTLGGITSIRVFLLILISSIIWIPIGVFLGTHPKIAGKVQPITEFFTAIPANIYFPITVMAISHYHLNVEIWLSFLMVIGAQWYILYNVIAGATLIPTELHEAAQNLGLKGFTKWKKMILPGIFPYYVTGAITASGGAWNASIVSEVVTWGDKTLSATGLGAYIVQNTNSGDYGKIALGIIVMCIYVVAINHFVWQKLYKYATEKFRLD